MQFDFRKKDKRMESNLAELKPVYRKKYIVVGTDSKGQAYTTTVDNVTFLDAKKDAKSWARQHDLKLDAVRAL